VNQTVNNAADKKAVVNMSPQSITNSDEMIPKVLYCPTAPLVGDVSHCLLDSGAEITVFLKLPATISNTRTAHAFGGTSLTLEKLGI